MSKSIRIGLFDADQDVRFGRKLVFASLPETEVVFDSNGTRDDLERIQESLIDVLVIDQQLASGSGVAFYSSLRNLTGDKQAPPAVITSSFAQPALLLEALEAGFSNVVAIEQGAEGLAETVTQARAGSNAHSLADLYQLVSSQPRVRAVDLSFVSLVDQLPEKLASNLRRLRSLWQKADVAKLEVYNLGSLNDLVSRLPVASAAELVLKLNRSGLLDE
jgi:DNA-binding NarL/FixJ family response regulator